MDTTKSSREGAVRQSRQAAPQNTRKQAPEQASRKPRPRQEEARKTGAKRPQSAPAQRPAEKQQRSAAQRPAGTGAQGKAPARSGKTPAKSVKAAPQQQRARRRPEQPDDLSSKKRAYGNSKPKKKSSFAVMGEAIAATAQQGAARRRARQQKEGKLSKRHPQQPTPAVIYTQPQAFNRDRLLVQLLTVTAVVVAFVVGISVFFKVGDIRVSGANVYTERAVEEASGIEDGDNLLTFSRARAGAQIKANLPYVKTVSFGIKLPDTVNIIIEEEDVVYAIKDQDEGWWLMNSDGYIVDQSNAGQAANYTQVLGVALDHPLRDQMAVAVEAMTVAPDPAADPTGQTEATVALGAMVTGEQRLKLAFQILKALEANDIVGEAASINVAQTESITLWYGTRYQVNLGSDANIEDKIATMNDVILQMSEYQSGILDISYTIWPDQVGYTPFS